jgi:hypothetical protein
VVRSLDVVYLVANFAKFSALNFGKLEVLKANSSATDTELRAGLAKQLASALYAGAWERALSRRNATAVYR